MLINKCDRILKMLLKCLIIVIVSHGITKQSLCEALRERIPLVRLPSNTLLKYTAYKDVSILHFDVPPDTRTAYFNFKAFEEAKSAFQFQCNSKDVTLHLKAGSYPVISPENITFPKHFLHADQRYKTYSLQFKSDASMRRMSVDGPQTGDWFAIAFVSWTDPSNDRIEQQGLSASCETLLLSEMSVDLEDPIILAAGKGLLHNNTLYANRNPPNDRQTATSTTIATSTIPTVTNTTNTNTNTTTTTINNKTSRDISNADQFRPKLYKFYVSRFVDIVRLRFAVLNVCNQCQAITINVRANGIPTADELMHSMSVLVNQTSDAVANFYPQQNAWHYIEIGFPADETATSTMGSVDATDSTANQVDGTELHVNFSIGLEFVNETVIDTNISDANNANEKNNGVGRDSKMTTSTASKAEVDYSNTVTQTLPTAAVTATTNLENTSRANEPKKNELDESLVKDDDDDDDELTNPSASKAAASSQGKPRNINYYALARQTYREFFMFDYDLLPDDNGSIPTFINLTAGTTTGFRFNIGNVYDIGGTMSFALMMRDNLQDAALAALESTTMRAKASRISSDMAVAEKLVQTNAADEATPQNSKMESLSFGMNRMNENADDIDNNTSRSNQTIIVCMHLGEPGIPTWPDKCVYGNKVFPAASIINNTNDETSTGLIHVPYPESGQWYVTLGLYCHGAETTRHTIIDSVKEFIKKYAHIMTEVSAPCACSSRNGFYQNCVKDAKCLANLSESETLKVKECLLDDKCTARATEIAQRFEAHHKLATEQSVVTDATCNASTVFTLSSSPCLAGRCGRYGRCYHYMSGGFVFSSCLCSKGYRGWDCTEDSQVPSSISILMAMLLLTLSNLLFIPSVYFAVRRKYFTEGIIYFFAMFFSIFYHACDSGEDEYSFCLVKLSVLQFCDFYCGLLAIWVTLIAMANMRQTYVSMLHMFGAILLAFGTELNKQSLWVFLAPALTGLCLISVSWGWRCRRTRKWFPGRRYLSIFLPVGMVLVMVGLVCYAFLQTRHNYFVVHSVWHMLMALSIICLLPSRSSFLPKC